LPQAGQKQLIRYLVLALGRYQMLAKIVRRVTPSQQRKQLKAVETTTRNLLLLLGINVKNVAPRAFWEQSSDRPSSERLRTLGRQSLDGLGVTNLLVSAGMRAPDRDEAAINNELGEVADRVADAVIALLCIHERAKTAVQAVAERIAPGRGGSRHRPKAKGQLIRDGIAIYAHMRIQYPDSGRKPGFGGPMLRFIHAVAALYGATVRDEEIRDVWRVWKSIQK
jgi:hypothetical protein